MSKLNRNCWKFKISPKIPNRIKLLHNSLKTQNIIFTPLANLFWRNAECPAIGLPAIGNLERNLASSAASTLAAGNSS